MGSAPIDIPPTVFALLGLPAHAAFQGVNLGIEGRRLHRPLFTLSQNPLADEVTVEQDGWMLRYDLRRNAMTLYDEWADAAEMREVSAENPEVRDALAGTIARWWTAQLKYYRSPLEQTLHYAPPARK